MQTACALLVAAVLGQTQPNIVLVVADDLGWNDVGYHNPQASTPKIDQYASEGTKLESFRVCAVCTPTRASLMTGRYPIRYGLQKQTVQYYSTYGLPLTERTLATALREVGYQTYQVGKWHLGHLPAPISPYDPHMRGFDRTFGMSNGRCDPFTHLLNGGLDWHRDGTPLPGDERHHTIAEADEAIAYVNGRDKGRPYFLYLAFNAVHSPIKVTPEYERLFIGTPEPRRKYLQMLRLLDDQVGRVVSAIDADSQSRDTLIFFVSDNGGDPVYGGSNSPLRAAKHSNFDGGVRVPAWVRWPLAIPAGAVRTQQMHATDVYPSFLRLAQAPPQAGLDGVDQCDVVAFGGAPVRTETLVNAVELSGDYAGAIVKVFEGVTYKWIREAGSTYLFDLDADPSEAVNIASSNTAARNALRDRFAALRAEAVPALYQPGPPLGWVNPLEW